MKGKNSKIYKLTSSAPSLTKRRIELLHPVWNNIIIIISLLLQARRSSYQFVLLSIGFSKIGDIKKLKICMLYLFFFIAIC